MAFGMVSAERSATEKLLPFQNFFCSLHEHFLDIFSSFCAGFKEDIEVVFYHVLAALVVGNFSPKLLAYGIKSRGNMQSILVNLLKIAFVPNEDINRIFWAFVPGIF